MSDTCIIWVTNNIPPGGPTSNKIGPMCLLGGQLSNLYYLLTSIIIHYYFSISGRDSGKRSDSEILRSGHFADLLFRSFPPS